MNENTVHAAAILARYAKHFGAGAFGSPLASDIDPDELVDIDGTVMLVKQTTRPSARKDWTGRKYVIPAGVVFATHVARADLDARVPEWVNAPDYLTTYVEDTALTAALSYRPVLATRISASAELITTWGPAGFPAHREEQVDRPTMAEVGPRFFAGVPEPMRAAVLAELDAVPGWYDDYPYYSDGSWGAVSLRGFSPDPLWGVKPAEMPKKWQQAHPESLGYKCDWTTFPAPNLRAVVDSLRWIGDLERVRLMRMEGQPRHNRLARHSDITDRNAGTRPGQIARFHLPLRTAPAITMSVWELDGHQRTQHLEPWKLYYLDQRKPHAVDNPTSVDRIHLVIDAVVDANVRRVIESCA